MNLSATLLAIVSTSVLGTNVALNLLRMSRPDLTAGQTVLCGYAISLIFVLCWGAYTDDIRSLAYPSIPAAISGYLLAGWACFMGSSYIHEITKMVERKRSARGSA